MSADRGFEGHPSPSLRTDALTGQPRRTRFESTRHRRHFSALDPLATSKAFSPQDRRTHGLDSVAFNSGGF